MATEHSPRMQHTEIRYEVHILAVSTSSKGLRFAGSASEDYCYFDNACPCISTQHVRFETFIVTLDWERKKLVFFFCAEKEHAVFSVYQGSSKR